MAPLGRYTSEAYAAIRDVIPFVDQDRVVSIDIRRAYELGPIRQALRHSPPLRSEHPAETACGRYFRLNFNSGRFIMQDVVVNWTNLDWLAIFMYLGGMILVGWYVSRKVRNSEDYLMAGRALSYPMVVATVAATWYGSGAVFGTAELAFGSGIAAFVVWCVPAHLGRIPLALWVAPRVRGVKENTIPALLGRLYARPVAILGAVLIVCYSSRLMDIVSVGIMGNTVTGLPNWVIGAVIVGVVICYSMFGGLWSVVMTDVLQFFLMTSLTLLLLPGVWTAVGGFEGLRTALPAGHFSPAGGMSVSQILVFFLLGFQVYADPAAYQRFGASNSAKTAKRAYLTCLLIWMAFDAVMTMLGLGARALYPELQGSKAFLTMAINAMPALPDRTVDLLHSRGDHVHHEFILPGGSDHSDLRSDQAHVPPLHD